MEKSNVFAYKNLKTNIGSPTVQTDMFAQQKISNG